MAYYRSNLCYPPVDNRSFGEPNAISYGTLSSHTAFKHHNTYGNPFSHTTTSTKNDNFDGVSSSHDYAAFLSQREVIITSQYQDSEESFKSKRHRSKSRSPHKRFYDKGKRYKRSISHEHKSRSIEIKKGSPSYKGDHYSFSNKRQSDSANTYNSKVIHQHDRINYDSSSKLSIPINENQHSDNSSSKNRYLPNITISQNLGQSPSSPNSSLESSPLDNEPSYYLNYPCTKKNMVIENPFSGALYLQNIQNRDDDNNTSSIPKFSSDTSAGGKGGWSNYEKDMLMQTSGSNREEFVQDSRLMQQYKRSPSVVLVSSDSEDKWDGDFNYNTQIFPNHNEKGFSGSPILSGENEHLHHSFSSGEKYMPTENFTSTSHSMIGIGNIPVEKEQVKVNLDENSLGFRENVGQSISEDNKDSIIPDFNSDTSKLTPEQWINLIEEVSRKKGWNDDDRRYMMTSRLKGLAGKWYLLKGITYKRWDSLKNEFIRSFPTQIEYYTLLKRMMSRKKEEDETIANYFHHKVALLNACEIYGQRAVSCIIYGITNDTVLQEAKLQNFNDIDSLYSYLRACHFTSESKYDENNRTAQPNMKKQVSTEVSQYKAIRTESSKTKAGKTQVVKTTGVKIKTVKVSKTITGNRCFRCGSPSHWKSACKNPPKLCCARCGQRNVRTKNCGC